MDNTTTNIISTKVANIQPSQTMLLSQKAYELQQQGIDIITLTAGVPGFNTPDVAAESGIDAIKSRFTQYTQVDGIPELKQAVIEKYFRDYNLNFNENEVMVTSGAKHSLHNIFNSLLNPGDEVILHAPYWGSYFDMIKLCDAKPTIIKGHDSTGFKLTAAELEKAISPKTKLLVLNNPCNPTGVVYTETDMKNIGEVILKHPKVLVVTDDIYDMIYWGRKPAQILSSSPELKSRTIIVNGVSKSYSMSGWRIGYSIASKEITAAMVKFQSQSLSNPCSISQKAALSAIKMPYKELSYQVNEYEQRVEYTYKRLINNPLIECLKPKGTFYLFPNVKKILVKLNLKTDIELCELLLDKAKIAVIPGSAFGLNGYIRITCSYDMSLLKKAMDRLSLFLENLKVVEDYD